jgi:hypothetical protein
MSKGENSALNDEDMLFMLLTALVKKNGGEVRISEEEMDNISKKDVVRMYYDKVGKEIILSTYSLSSS